MANLTEQANLSFLSGMNDSAPATAMKDSEAALLLNYRVTPDGEAQVRYGSKRTHTTALNSGAQGYGAIAFKPTGGNAQWVVFAGDAAYYSADEGVTWTLITSALRQDYWDFAVMRKSGTAYLLCANGGTSSYKWDGTTWSAISGIRSGSKRLEVHNDRLWATDGKVVDGSKINDFEHWTAPSAIVGLEVQTHGGEEEIIALYSWGQLLLVFRRSEIGYIEGYGNADLITAAGSKGVSRDVGCIAFRSIVGVGGRGLIFQSRRGFELLAPGLEPMLVSRTVESFLAEINISDIEATPGLPCAYFYPNKLTYECYLPGAAGQNDQAFVYRIPTIEKPGAASIFDGASASGQTVSVTNGFLLVDGGGSRLRTKGGFLQVVSGDVPGAYAVVTGGFLDIATNDTMPAAVFTADRTNDAQRPISIGYDGFVRKLDDGSLDDVVSDGTGGTAIGDRLKGRPMVFGDPFRRKRGRVIRVLTTTETEQTLSVALIADGTQGTAHTKTLAASTKPVQSRFRVNGRGNELVVDIQSAGAGTKVGGVAIAAEPLAERP